jgi:hypothetical protein
MKMKMDMLKMDMLSRSRMMEGKRSQVKMGETIAILFIFFILLIIGAVFYMNLQRTTVYRDIEQAYELRAVELSQVISFLPELQCTEANVVKASCFDIHKLQGLSQVVQSDLGLLMYDREFGQTKIEVLVIYPPAANIPIWDRPKPGYTSAPVTHIPISLFDSTSGKRAFGILEITVYS